MTFPERIRFCNVGVADKVTTNVFKALRSAPPLDGYKSAVDLADYGQPMINCKIIYRILEDGTVLTIFDYTKLMAVQFSEFMGVMYQEKLDVYQGGIFRYFPKTLPIVTEEGEFDFSNRVALLDKAYPRAKNITREYWANADSPCERVVDYFQDNQGKDVLAFACGYLPIYDAAPSKRKNQIDRTCRLVYTRKHYPIFAEGDLQSVRGVGYKKYFMPAKDKASVYQVTFDGESYVYVDFFKQEALNVLVDGNLSLLESTSDITYQQNGNELVVSGNKGFAVFRVQHNK